MAILFFSWFGQAVDGAASSQSKRARGRTKWKLKEAGPPDLGWNGDDYTEHLALAVV